jgi:hypothetical protein
MERMNEDKARALARQARDARRNFDRAQNREVINYYSAEMARLEKAAREEGATDALIENPDAPWPSIETCEKARVAEEAAWERIAKQAKVAKVAKVAKRGHAVKATAADATEVKRIIRLQQSGNREAVLKALRSFRKSLEGR